MNKLKIVLALIIVGMISVAIYGCESCQRSFKSIQSSATGLERKVVWTGYDGSKKVWKGQFKIDSNENNPTVYFVDEKGKTVILGPGYYSVEVD